MGSPHRRAQRIEGRLLASNDSHRVPGKNANYPGRDGSSLKPRTSWFASLSPLTSSYLADSGRRWKVRWVAKKHTKIWARTRSSRRWRIGRMSMSIAFIDLKFRSTTAWSLCAETIPAVSRFIRRNLVSGSNLVGDRT